MLEMLTEKEREEEIFKRAEKREMLKSRYEIEKKLKLQRKSAKEEGLVKGLDTKQRRKFMSCSRCQELCEQAQAGS